MNKLTLNDFLFSLNQDEDIRVKIADPVVEGEYIEAWKSDLHSNPSYNHFKDWNVDSFLIGYINGNTCIEIEIVPSIQSYV